MKIHVSTQASVSNYQAARAWHDLGADRVILARELSLSEIAEIGPKPPGTWNWRPSPTGPCACPTPAGACCPTT